MFPLIALIIPTWPGAVCCLSNNLASFLSFCLAVLQPRLRFPTTGKPTRNIVYNNFPWPTPTDAQKAKIEETAQTILDARALYPDSSLADLYDETTMPLELRKAHQQNDKAVMRAYGFDIKTTTEATCVAELMRMCQTPTEEGNKKKIHKSKQKARKNHKL